MAQYTYVHRVVLDVTPLWWVRFQQHMAQADFRPLALQILERVLSQYPHCYSLGYDTHEWQFCVTILVSDRTPLEEVTRTHEAFVHSLDALKPAELATKEKLP